MRKVVSIAMLVVLAFLQVEGVFAKMPSSNAAEMTMDHHHDDCCDDEQYELTNKTCASDCLVAILFGVVSDKTLSRARLVWSHALKRAPFQVAPTGPPPILFLI